MKWQGKLDLEPHSKKRRHLTQRTICVKTQAMFFTDSIPSFIIIFVLTLATIWLVYRNVKATFKLLKSSLFARSQKVAIVVLIWILPFLGAMIAEHLIDPSDDSPSDRYMGQSIDEAKSKGHHFGL